MHTRVFEGWRQSRKCRKNHQCIQVKLKALISFSCCVRFEKSFIRSNVHICNFLVIFLPIEDNEKLTLLFTSRCGNQKEYFRHNQFRASFSSTLVSMEYIQVSKQLYGYSMLSPFEAYNWAISSHSLNGRSVCGVAQCAYIVFCMHLLFLSAHHSILWFSSFTDKLHYTIYVLHF